MIGDADRLVVCSKRQQADSWFEQETMMRQITLMMIALLAYGGAAARASSEHRNTEAEQRGSACEQWRDSKASALSGEISVQSEGAMTSGLLATNVQFIEAPPRAHSIDHA